MAHLTRRQFLTLSASTAGAVLLPRCASNQVVIGQTSDVIRSQAGLLGVTLTTRQTKLRIGETSGVFMSYNDQIPGTRLEAHPGDTVKIRLHNQLPQATNLHYHGLHISPTGNADNVFLSIPMGETPDYEFRIPENHPAGIFYYHPHLHGSVEDWELVNSDPDGMDHPFHLHVNPFQIISRNGQPEPYRVWKDTVLVKGYETVRIRIPFRDFTGKTVYHCHILDHEDLGMMGLIQIDTALANKNENSSSRG